MFQFEVKAVDSGVPQKGVTKEVILRVVHDEFAPEFVDAPYTSPELPENKPVGHRVFQLSGRDKDQKVRHYVNIILLHGCIKCQIPAYFQKRPTIIKVSSVHARDLSTDVPDYFCAKSP